MFLTTFSNIIIRSTPFIVPKNCVFVSKHIPSILQKFSKEKQNDPPEHLANYHNKLITISPGGLKGFYMLGIASYIKEHYAKYLEDYNFSGASAGSWIALFMVFKGNKEDFVSKILNSGIDDLKIINEIKYKIKYKILSSYNETDFDLERIYIGVSSLKNFKLITNIYSKFDSLEDVLDCCIASSHIPFITGGMTQKYHNIYSYDGGFSDYPYTKYTEPSLHITPDVWNTFLKEKMSKIESYTTLLSRNKYNFTDLYREGYKDTMDHKKELDKIFLYSKNNVK
jgi:hypothetical protein